MKRSDGIPHPQTVGDAYLAAILDEIRALRQDLNKPQDTEEIEVKEPARKPKERK